MNFDDAERKFADFKNQRDSGQISPADFTARIHEIRLQDIGGVWWQISEQDGKWLRWNGSAWVPGEPVRIAASTTPVINSAPIPMAPTQYYRPAGDNGNKWKFVILGILGIAAIIAVIVYLNIGGIGNSIGLGGGPESVVLERFQAFDAGNYNRALDLTVTESESPLDENIRSQLLDYYSTVYGTQGERIEINNLHVTNSQKITDKKFNIDVTMELTQTEIDTGKKVTVPYFETLNLVKVNGDWKVVQHSQQSNTGNGSSVSTGSNNYAGYPGVYTPAMTQKPMSYSTIVNAVPQSTTAMITGTNIPILLSPSNGALMDNGCKAENDRIIWDFQWSKVPKATQYQIYVIGKTAINPVVNSVTVNNLYHYESPVGSEVQGGNNLGWSWRVRAQVDGIWKEYSNQKYFDLRPVCT